MFCHGVIVKKKIYRKTKVETLSIDLFYSKFHAVRRYISPTSDKIDMVIVLVNDA